MKTARKESRTMTRGYWVFLLILGGWLASNELDQGRHIVVVGMRFGAFAVIGYVVIDLFQSLKRQVRPATFDFILWLARKIRGRQNET